MEYKIKKKLYAIVDGKEFGEGYDIAVTIGDVKYIAVIHRIIPAEGSRPDALVLSNIEMYEGNSVIPSSNAPHLKYVELPNVTKVSYVSID